MKGPRQGETRPVRFVTPLEMSFHPFSFPFSEPTRIRQALSLQLSSLLGEAAAGVHIHPVILRRENNLSRGFALVLCGEKDANGDPAARTRFFPAPLALGGSLAGEGLGVWADEERVACVLWREGIPVLYRCSARAEGEPGEVVEWVRRTSGTDFETLILDSRADPDAKTRLESEAVKTWSAFPSLASIDLSSRQMDFVFRLQDLSSFLKPLLTAVLVLGLLFDGAAGLALLSARARLAGYEEAATRLYREVFDPTGPVRDPLSQAKARLAAASGTDKAKSLAGALAMLGPAEAGTSSGIVLDTLRISEQQAELTGKGDSVEGIRAFQQAIGESGSSLEDLQQLPGGQFRFRLTLRRETP